MINTRSLLACSSAALALIATPAFAQDSFEDEVIVTATKRQTTLQDTPVAVSVTSADVIEKAQILDIKDLQSVVPTFRVSQLQNSANTTLSIRGFGSGGNNIGIEPSVALFVDGVFRSRAAAQIGDLPNLERIEVLSGPQSTLFGKNASAGVVSIVTAEPSFDTEGYIEGGYGNYDLMYAKGYLSGAIHEDIAVSLGGGIQVRDGYFEPAPGTEGGNFNDTNRFNIRAQALWEPTDDFSARLILDRSTMNENCCATSTAIPGAADVAIISALGGTIPGLGNPFGYVTTVNRATDNEIKDQGASLQLEKDFDWLGGVNFTSITSYRTNERVYSSDNDFTSLRLLDDVFDDVEIETFTQEFRIASTGSGPLSWLVGGLYFDESIDNVSGLEFGPDVRAFVDALGSGGASLSGNPADSALIGAEVILGLPIGTIFSDDVSIREFFTQENDSISLFANIDYELSDRLTLSVGGAYVEDNKEVAIRTENNDAFSNLTLQGADGTRVISTGLFLAGDAGTGTPSFSQALGGLPFTPANLAAAQSGAFGPAAQGYVDAVLAASAALAASPASPLNGLLIFQTQPQFLDFPNSVEDGITKDDDFTYSVKLAYEVNDNFNVYASTSTGFKATSWNLTRNSRPFLSDAAALQSAGLLPNNYIPASGRNFGTRFALPEEATVYELGLKARFEWGAFNVAVFDQVIENFQSTIFDGVGFVLANAGKQSTQGVEFDATFTPYEGLSLGVAGLIQDPVFDDFVGASVIPGSPEDAAFSPSATDGVGDLSGAKPGSINEVALTFSAQYEFEISDTIDSFVRADYQYEDEVRISNGLPASFTRDTSVVNGAIGFTFDDTLDVRFWGRNLFNHETFTSGFTPPLQFGTVGAYPNQPRTYGVSVRKNF